MLLALKVLTLNVWGIPFVSSDREQRIAAIGKELSTGKYDIVSLQEVWSQKDYQTLKEMTEAILPYSHYFYSGVVGAGLLVLSKYPIIGTLFHAWCVNGYFHRVQHADWFGGKGVGLCKIQVGEQVVHLYNAHLHAEYNNENDEYKTHRVIQAFDTAQFIEATRGTAVLQILAGDLNTQPEDICYKVLLYGSKMDDCCTSKTIFTNECNGNSYTSKRALAMNPHGSRIDHIFVRSADHIETSIEEYKLPFPERVPGQNFSYSDHEAVMVKLKLQEYKSASSASKFCYANEDVACETASIVANGEQRCGNDVVNDSATMKRIGALQEAIGLCETSLQQLKIDRILYYSVAIFMFFVVIALAEFPAPSGFKTVFLLLKFICFAIILFSIFMGSIWNFMERNGVLSGKVSMEILLQYTKKSGHEQK